MSEKPSDIIHHIDLLNRQHKGAVVTMRPNPLREACRETWQAYQFFAEKNVDPFVAAQLAGIALDNIMEDE